MSAPIFKPTDDGLVRRMVERLKFGGGVSGKGHTSLEARAGWNFIVSRDGSFLCTNCYYDWATGTWNRIDIALPASAVYATGAGALNLLTVAAGANPITWTTSTLAQGADSGWLDLGSFGTNWSSYLTSDDFKAQYRKLPSGLVLLRGLVKKGAALALPETIATLPAGFRPGAASRQQIFAQANAAANVTDLRVTGAGGISLQGGGSVTWIALDGISFLAEL